LVAGSADTDSVFIFSAARLHVEAKGTRGSDQPGGALAQAGFRQAIFLQRARAPVAPRADFG